MKVRKRKVKDGPDFCFGCGITLEATAYILDLGTPSTTFPFCKSCLKKLNTKTGKALAKK